MTRKNTKFTLGIKIASILTCLAMTAIGFAAWLIVKTPDPVTQTGDFTVYTVAENNVTITVAPKSDGSTDIIFGKPATTNNDNWLYAQGDMSAEQLTAIFSVTVTSVVAPEGAETPLDLDEIFDKLTFAFACNDSEGNANTNFAEAVKKGYITAPVFKLASDGEAVTEKAVTADVKTMTFDLYVSFGWGDALNNQNPYTYYNGQAYTPTLAGEAKAALSAIAAIADAQYSITVATAKNPATSD